MVMEIIVSSVVLFVGIAVLVVIHLCMGGRGFGRGRGIDGVTVIERGNISAKRMTKEELRKLPSYAFMAEEKEGTTSGVDCAICLETFKVGEKCRFLPNCRHSFHVQCVDFWLLKTPICPICRTSANPSKTDLNLEKEMQFAEF